MSKEIIINAQLEVLEQIVAENWEPIYFDHKRVEFRIEQLKRQLKELQSEGKNSTTTLRVEGSV